MGRYHIGQACLNGHAINGYSDKYREHNSQFCGECGATTITTCPACSQPIRGKFQSDGVFTARDWQPAAFCYACGKPYPWTAAATQAISAAIDEIDELAADSQKLKSSIPDLLTDTPNTGAAVLRFKKAMKKAGALGSKILYDTIVKVAAEVAVKGLGI
jgi:hypothetical protein